MEPPKCKICGKGHYGICPEAFQAAPKTASMEPHHIVWLSDHPSRTSEWLKVKLLEGFEVHHVDGDHSNNSIDNLLLVDGSDHRRLHRKIMPVLSNEKAPFDRNAYQRDLMRKRRAKLKAEKDKAK